MQARHVRTCATADQANPTGPADRRYGKGQTFTGEVAAASSSVSSALDRAIEQSLVRRKACHGRRTRIIIDPDTFALGGSRMAALFRDNCWRPWLPRRTISGLRVDNSVSPVRHVRASSPLASPRNPLVSPVALFLLLAYHPYILFPSCASQQTQDDDISRFSFFLVNTSDFLFALPLGHVCYSLDFL